MPSVEIVTIIAQALEIDIQVSQEEGGHNVESYN